MRILRLLAASLVFVALLLFLVLGTSLQDSEVARLQVPAADTPTGVPTNPSENPVDTATPEPAATPTNTPTPEPTGIDTTAPRILSLDLESTEVDTTASSQALTITARITDDLSGLRLAVVRFVPAVGGTQYLDFQLRPDLRMSGDRRDGVYVAAAVLPKYAVHGRWILSEIALSDNANNSIAALGAIDGSGKAIAVEQPYFINGEDSGPPVEPPVDPPAPSEGGVTADATPWVNDIYMPLLGE